MDCLQYMRGKGYMSIEATREAEENWRKHTNEVADKSLFPLAQSWVRSVHLGLCVRYATERC